MAGVQVKSQREMLMTGAQLNCFMGWECNFRTHEVIPYRMVQVPLMCGSSGAAFVLEAGSTISVS